MPVVWRTSEAYQVQAHEQNTTIKTQFIMDVKASRSPRQGRSTQSTLMISTPFYYTSHAGQDIHTMMHRKNKKKEAENKNKKGTGDRDGRSPCSKKVGKLLPQKDVPAKNKTFDRTKLPRQRKSGGNKSLTKRSAPPLPIPPKRNSKARKEELRQCASSRKRHSTKIHVRCNMRDMPRRAVGTVSLTGDPHSEEKGAQTTTRITVLPSKPGFP